MTAEQESIIELAETIKEIVRLMKNNVKEGSPFDNRLDEIYKKASKAKNRMKDQ